MDKIDFDYLKKINFQENVIRIIEFHLEHQMFKNTLIIGGRSMRELSRNVAEKMKIDYCDSLIDDFPNTEIRVELDHSLRNKEIFIFQTGIEYQGRSINDHFMELIMIISVCRRSSAKKINVVMPFYPYSRSDKKDKPRTTIAARDIADILHGQQIDRLITFDLHSGQVQGFGNFPFDNIYGINIFIDYFNENIFNELIEKYQRILPEDYEDNDRILNEILNERFVLVSPDAGGIKRIEDYAERLKINYVIMHKKRDYTKPGNIIKSILIGEREEVEGKTAIVIDDMIDTAGTCISSLGILEENGVKDVIIVVTHGLLSESAIDRINNCDLINKVIVLNTVPQDENLLRCDKLICIDMTNFLSDILESIMKGESLHDFFH